MSAATTRRAAVAILATTAAAWRHVRAQPPAESRTGFQKPASGALPQKAKA